MREIVINKCYGGFTLSPIAVKEYVKRKFGKELHVYRLVGFNPEKYEEVSSSDIEDGNFFSPTYTLGPISNDQNLDDIFFSAYRIERDDPILIEVVKELGDKANTIVSDLKIVEIPEDIEWVISEYDGLEWIDEKHRSWN